MNNKKVKHRIIEACAKSKGLYLKPDELKILAQLLDLTEQLDTDDHSCFLSAKACAGIITKDLGYCPSDGWYKCKDCIYHVCGLKIEAME